MEFQIGPVTEVSEFASGKAKFLIPTFKHFILLEQFFTMIIPIQEYIIFN